MATGLKMNDPTWEPLEQEFVTGLDAMKETASAQPREHSPYGRGSFETMPARVTGC